MTQNPDAIAFLTVFIAQYFLFSLKPLSLKGSLNETGFLV